MSVAYHGASDQVLDAFAQGVLSLEDHDARKYYEQGVRMSPAAVRNALEALMETSYQEPFSRLGLRYFREGEAQGLEVGLEKGLEKGRALERIRGKHEMLRMALELRGLVISGSQDRVIEDCEDLETLEKWIAKAKTATNPDEVFS